MLMAAEADAQPAEGATVRYEVSEDIDAPLERIWSVLTDVESMPEWTSSMTHVRRLDQGVLAVGSTVRIKQPWLPAAVWRVCELTPMRSFSWTATSGGMTTTAGHALTTGSGRATTVTLTIRQNGLLAPFVGLLTAALTRRYVNAEMQGLKLRSERPV